MQLYLPEGSILEFCFSLTLGGILICQVKKKIRRYAVFEAADAEWPVS